MRGFFLALSAVLLALPMRGEPGAVFRVDFSNPGLTPSRWTLIVHPDGSGHFHSERGNAPHEDPQVLDVPNVDRDIQLSGQFAQRVFQAARVHRLSGAECESHMKVAFQGWKKLSYTGPDGEVSCEFNYSKNKEIQSLADSLVAVASTILEGARLEMLLSYDRLGLDKEMEYMVEAAGDGRLQQICAIRGILERLADDPGVMERVRKRARILLARAEK